MIGAGLIFQPSSFPIALSNRGVDASFYEALQKVFYYCYPRLIFLITPPDPVSMLLMAFPLIILYEMLFMYHGLSIVQNIIESNLLVKVF